MKHVAVACAAIFIAGCASAPTGVVVLQNPETKQTVECQSDPWYSATYRIPVEQCIANYEKIGYKIVIDPGKN